MIVDKDVLSWLEKGGFVFEHDCIKAFNKSGFDCMPGLHYHDATTNQYREIDFMANRQLYIKDLRLSLNVCLVIECKAHIEPIIAIDSSRSIDGKICVSNIIGTHNASYLKGKMFNSLVASTFTFGMRDSEVMAQNVVVYRQSAKKALSEHSAQKKDRVYESMMQSYNACHYLRKSSNENDARFCNLYIPVVIFDNALFRVSFEGGNPSVSEIKFCKSSRIYAFKKENPVTVFHVVSKQGIVEYSELIYSEIERLFDLHIEDIKYIAKNEPSNGGSALESQN